MDELYRSIVAQVDEEFARNRRVHRDRIRCAPGCTDCCHHRFQITDIEAASIARGLHTLHPSVRYRLEQQARTHVTSAERSPCPALHNGACSIYEHRPLICHKFGMPIYNPDRPETILACELNFRAGDEIRDGELVQIQTGIHHQWRQLQSEYYSSARYCHSGPITVADAILNAPLWYSGQDA